MGRTDEPVARPGRPVLTFRGLRNTSWSQRVTRLACTSRGIALLPVDEPSPSHPPPPRKDTTSTRPRRLPSRVLDDYEHDRPDCQRASNADSVGRDGTGRSDPTLAGKSRRPKVPRRSGPAVWFGCPSPDHSAGYGCRVVFTGDKGNNTFSGAVVKYSLDFLSFFTEAVGVFRPKTLARPGFRRW